MIAGYHTSKPRRLARTRFISHYINDILKMLERSCLANAKILEGFADHCKIDIPRLNQQILGATPKESIHFYTDEKTSFFYQ